MTGPGTSKARVQQNKSPSHQRRRGGCDRCPPPSLPPARLGESWTDWGWVGGARATTSLPSSGKSGPRSTLCLTRAGAGWGGRAPLHPTPCRQAGRGRGPDSGGRAGLSSLSNPPPPPTSGCPHLPPPRRSPHLFPRRLWATGAQAGGGVWWRRGVRAPQPAPAGTKCAGLGPAPPGARRGSGGQFANTK